jgi:hypothetical protein
MVSLSLADVILIIIAIIFGVLIAVGFVGFFIAEFLHPLLREFVASYRKYNELNASVELLRGRRIRKATARKLVSAGLPPGRVVFATHYLADDWWKRDVYVIRVLEDFGQCPFRKGLRFYLGKIEHQPVQHSK